MKLKGEVKHFVAEVQKHLPPEHHARLRALSAKYLSEQRTIARTLSHQQRVIAQQRDKSAAQAAEITMLRGEVQDGKNAISQLQHELAQMQMNIADYLVAIGSAALWGVDLQAKVSGAAKHAHSTGKINTAIEYAVGLTIWKKGHTHTFIGGDVVVSVRIEGGERRVGVMVMMPSQLDTLLASRPDIADVENTFLELRKNET